MAYDTFLNPRMDFEALFKKESDDKPQPVNKRAPRPKEDEEV